MMKHEDNLKVAIMQPYLFPYIGYWQLMNMVDIFVLLDDVNYIKRGYINRNSILLQGKDHLFTIPLEGASQNKLIKDTKMAFNNKEKDSFLRQIEFAYKKAPLFDIFFPVLRECIQYDSDDLTSYIFNSIEQINKYTNINTKILKSSEMVKNKELKAQQRIVEICKLLGAEQYINPIGGRELYDRDAFSKEGIELFFLEADQDKVVYHQFQSDFVANLSVIDVLMFNDKYNFNQLLLGYKVR